VKAGFGCSGVVGARRADEWVGGPGACRSLAMVGARVLGGEMLETVR
jgi:hypothetical protein